MTDDAETFAICQRMAERRLELATERLTAAKAAGADIDALRPLYRARRDAFADMLSGQVVVLSAFATGVRELACVARRLA